MTGSSVAGIMTAAATLITAVVAAYGLYRGRKVVQTVNEIHILTNRTHDQMKALLQLYRNTMTDAGVPIPKDPSVSDG